VITYPANLKSAEEILELAIEAMADDCQSNEEVHEISCSLEGFHAVRDYLESKIGEPLSAKLIWKADIVNTLNQALEELDDVQSVWANLELPDDFED
jgi:transcriptional/translational regulatory protein YebC/TACO1